MLTNNKIKMHPGILGKTKHSKSEGKKKKKKLGRTKKYLEKARLSLRKLKKKKTLKKDPKKIGRWITIM